MKNITLSGVLVLMIIGVLYIIFLRECKGPDPCPPAGEILIKKSVWDSIIAIGNKPPEVIKETIYIKGPTVYVDRPVPVPMPDPNDTAINHYSDTLLKKDIDVVYSFSVRGTLLKRTWEYRPVQTVIRIDSIVYVPKIVTVEKDVPVAQNGLYGYGIAGGNNNMFLFGGGIDYITKKNTEIGYLYQRFGNENIHSIKIGAKLFKK